MGHSDSVNTVAFSLDSKLVASGSSDMTVKIWDAAVGSPLETFEGHSDSVNTVAFSPDGKLVASGSSDMTVRIWDATTGATEATLMADAVFRTLASLTMTHTCIRIRGYMISTLNLPVLFLPS